MSDLFEVVVLNANTSEEITAIQHAFCQEQAGERTRITAIQPTWGPPAVQGWVDAYRSAAAMADRIASFEGPMDALILAAYGDLGREALAELVSVPVIDVTEAAAKEARKVTTRYGVVTTNAEMTPLIEQSLRLSGDWDDCVGIFPMGSGIGTLRADDEGLLDSFRTASAKAVAQGAEAICLGAAALSDRWPKLAATLDVPLIEPIAAALSQAESLIDTDLRASAAPYTRDYAR